MDTVAVTINITIVVLSLYIGHLGILVGRSTGNLNWWVSFTAGWILIAVARSITALTYSDLLQEDYYRNISGLMVVVALIMMLYGMLGFSNNILSKVKKHE